MVCYDFSISGGKIYLGFDYDNMYSVFNSEAIKRILFDEVGKFDTVLIRRGTEKIKDSTAAWNEYASQQEENETVVPLMVFQVPNTPDPAEIGRSLDTIFISPFSSPELPSGNTKFSQACGGTFKTKSPPSV